MKISELRTALGINYSDLEFQYHGKPCGVTSTVHHSKPSFQAWCGDELREYHNVDAVMADRFYDGKTLVELLDEDVPFYF